MRIVIVQRFWICTVDALLRRINGTLFFREWFWICTVDALLRRINGTLLGGYLVHRRLEISTSLSLASRRLGILDQSPKHFDGLSWLSKKVRRTPNQDS